MTFTVSTPISIIQNRVRRVVFFVRTQVHPLLDVVMCNGTVVFGIILLSDQAGDLSHRFEANHTLESKIGLITTVWSAVNIIGDAKRWAYRSGPAKSSVDSWFAG